MLNELFQVQAGTVLLITACIVAAMTLFYVEVMALNECKNHQLLVGCFDRDLCISVVPTTKGGLPH